MEKLKNSRPNRPPGYNDPCVVKLGPPSVARKLFFGTPQPSFKMMFQGERGIEIVEVVTDDRDVGNRAETKEKAVLEAASSQPGLPMPSTLTLASAPTTVSLESSSPKASETPVPNEGPSTNSTFQAPKWKKIARTGGRRYHRNRLLCGEVSEMVVDKNRRFHSVAGVDDGQGVS